MPICPVSGLFYLIHLCTIPFLLIRCHLVNIAPTFPFSLCPDLTLTLRFTTWRKWHVLSCPALPCPALPCPALPCPALPCPVKYSSDCTALSCHLISGAGRFPTANSVLNDLVRVSQSRTSPPFPLSSEVAVKPDYAHTFYIRIKSRNTVGTLSTHRLLNPSALYVSP